MQKNPKKILVVIGGGMLTPDQSPNKRWSTIDFGQGGDKHGVMNDRWRVLAAAEFWKKDPETLLLLTGGKGQFTNTRGAPTVASVLESELLELGVPKSSIIKETDSGATFEQLHAIAKLLKKWNLTKLEILSNDWHLPRMQAFLHHGPGLKEAFSGINVNFISAEDILAPISSDWKEKIRIANTDPGMIARRAKEAEGIKAIKSGTYKYPKFSKITLRPATIADALMLLEWRNDEETRKQSVNMDKILWEVHLPWLEKVLSNPNRKLMIAESESIPVGTVRLDVEEPRSELSWTIAPGVRGKGFGTLMVTEAVKYFGRPLKIIIKPGNLASFKVAEKAGFKKINETADITNWIYDK